MARAGAILDGMTVWMAHLAKCSICQHQGLSRCEIQKEIGKTIIEMSQ